MLTILVMGFFYKLINTYRGRGFILDNPLDYNIPFVSWFSVPYLFWYYPLLIIVGLVLARYSIKNYYKMIIAINLGMFISFLVYFIYPTVVPRPLVEGNDIFSRLTSMIYDMDNPYNCYPSIHVIKSILIAYYFGKTSHMSNIYKILIWTLSVVIIFSTMYIKQHYVLDFTSGLAVSVFVCVIVDYLDKREILTFGK